MAIGRTQEEATRITRAAYEAPEAFEAFLGAAAINADESDAISSGDSSPKPRFSSKS